MGAIKGFVRQVLQDDVPGLSAELAFRFLFAIFPFVLFMGALAAFVASWLGVADPTTGIMNALGNNLPSNLAGTVRGQLETVVGHARPDLLSIGALVAIYASAGGTNAFIKAMNRAYDVQETRSFPFRVALACGLTALAGVGIVGSFALMVGSSIVAERVAAGAGSEDAALSLLSLLRWPAVFVILTIAATILFRYGPNVRPPWRLALTGAIAFAVGWLVATYVFSVYVARFGRYDVTYGALAGVIVLLLWFYLTAMVLVLAAELVALLVRRRAPDLLDARRKELAAPAPE